MATIAEIAEKSGLSASTVSRILRKVPPYSENAQLKVEQAVQELSRVPAQVRQPTIRDVAALAGVSISTVSNVLNGLPVSSEKEENVLRAVSALKYQPNYMGRSLRRTDSLRIIAAVSNPYYRAVQGIYQGAAETGADIIMMHTGINKNSDFVRMLDSGQANGILFFDLFDPLFVSELGKKWNVIQCAGCTNVTNVSSVTCDYSAAGKELTAELIRQGHRRIRLITCRSVSGEKISFMEEFQNGWFQALSEAELPLMENALTDWGSSVFTNHDCRPQYAYAEQLAVQPPEKRPDAIIVPTARTASYLIQSLHQFQVRVPEDIAVASILSTDNNHSAFPFITTMLQDWYNMACEAVKRLAYQIRNGCLEPAHIVLPHTIELCGSTHAELGLFGHRPLQDNSGS